MESKINMYHMSKEELESHINKDGYFMYDMGPTADIRKQISDVQTLLSRHGYVMRDSRHIFPNFTGCYVTKRSSMKLDYKGWKPLSF